MNQEIAAPFSRLNELHQARLHLPPFSCFRAVRCDNNAFYLALGYTVMLHHQRYRSTMLKMPLDKFNIGALSSKLSQTDFDKLRTTFFTLLQRYKLKYPGIYQFKVTEFMESRPYAATLLILLVRNYLILNYLEKFDRDDEIALKNYLSQPTKNIKSRALECFQFHYYEAGKVNCSHETCCYFYQMPYGLYILQEPNQIKQKIKELQTHSGKLQILKQCQHQPQSMVRGVRLCVGCGKSINLGVVCLKCLTKKIRPPNLQQPKPYLPLIKEYEPPELQIWRAEPLKHDDVASFKGSSLGYKVKTEQVSETIKPLSKHSEKVLQFDFVRPSENRRQKIINIAHNNVSQVVVPLNPSQRKQNLLNQSISQLQPTIEQLPVRRLQPLKEVMQGRFTKQSTNPSRYLGKESRFTRGNKQMIRSQSSAIPKSLSPVFRMEVPLRSRQANYTRQSHEQSIFDQLAKYRKKNLLQPVKTVIAKPAELTFCQRCGGVVAGGFRYCGRRCQEERLKELSKEVQMSGDMASPHLLDQLQAHLHRRLCQQTH